jgi:hypothetical protein
MSDLYTDLDLYTTGHAGSTDDPFSWDDFIANVIASGSPNNYYIKGKKEFDAVGFADIVISTDIDTTADTFTVANNYPTGTPILLVSDDPPEPLESNTVYWIINVDPTTIKVAATYNDAITNTFIDLTSQGSVSHKIYQIIVYWPSLGIMHHYLGWDTVDNGPWRLNFVLGAYSFISLQGYLSDSIMYFPDEDEHYFYFDNVNIFNSFLKLPKNVFYSNNTDTFGSSLITPYSNNLIINSGVVANFRDSVICSKFEGPGAIASVVNCVTTAATPTETDNELKGTIDILLTAKVQYGWTAPTWPNWYDDEDYWSSEVLGIDITVPPNPGTPPYYGYDTGLFGEPRLGIGAFYFVVPQPVDIQNTYISSKIVTATEPQVKRSDSMSCIGWIKNPAVEDGDILIPLAIADPYENVLNTDASIRFEIYRDGLDYRLQYSGSKSKLISKTLKIKIDDNNWHTLSYESDVDGNMSFSVDGINLPPEDGVDQYGLPYSVAKSLSSRVGGGKVWAPYIYKQKQIVYLYNWRFGRGFNLGLTWINQLKNVDKIYLKIE